MIKSKNEKYSNENFTYYEYIFDTEFEQSHYWYPGDEEIICVSTGAHNKKYYTLTKQYSNFISKVRALTEENKGKTFFQKHNNLAREIQEAARKGHNTYWAVLNDNEINDLRAEGFNVEEKPYREDSKISW